MDSISRLILLFLVSIFGLISCNRTTPSPEKKVVQDSWKLPPAALEIAHQGRAVTVAWTDSSVLDPDMNIVFSTASPGQLLQLQSVKLSVISTCQVQGREVQHSFEMINPLRISVRSLIPPELGQMPKLPSVLNCSLRLNGVNGIGTNDPFQRAMRIEKLHKLETLQVVKSNEGTQPQKLKLQVVYGSTNLRLISSHQQTLRGKTSISCDRFRAQASADMPLTDTMLLDQLLLGEVEKPDGQPDSRRTHPQQTCRLILESKESTQHPSRVELSAPFQVLFPLPEVITKIQMTTDSYGKPRLNDQVAYTILIENKSEVPVGLSYPTHSGTQMLLQPAINYHEMPGNNVLGSILRAGLKFDVEIEGGRVVRRADHETVFEVAARKKARITARFSENRDLKCLDLHSIGKRIKDAYPIMGFIGYRFEVDRDMPLKRFLNWDSGNPNLAGERIAQGDVELPVTKGEPILQGWAPHPDAVEYFGKLLEIRPWIRHKEPLGYCFSGSALSPRESY